MVPSYEVILDANFLMVPKGFNIDVFTELKRVISKNFSLITLSSVVKELEKMGSAGKLALKMLKSKDVKVVDSKRNYADNDIVEYAKKGNVIVCTNDKELQDRLVKENTPVVYFRGKNTLGLKGILMR